MGVFIAKNARFTSFCLPNVLISVSVGWGFFGISLSS